MDAAQLLASLPDAAGVTAADVARAAEAAGTALVVLDDDPTGTQSVADLPVLARWRTEDLRWALERSRAVYVLTNTRSLGPDDAAARTREVVRNALAVARELGVEVAFTSRSDSTLRGHFPLEPDVIAEELVAAGAPAPDGVVIVPAFPDAGRVTVHGVHYYRDGDRLVPVGETEFARDATFGYASSHLADWVEEKTGGRVPAADVVVLDVATVREGPEAVARVLRGLTGGAPVVVDAATEDDLRSVALGCSLVEGEGRHLVYRVGPAFVRARAGQEAPAVVDRVRVADGAPGGLVVVGSHTALTTRQLEALLRSGPSPVVLELSVADAVDPDRREAHLAERAAAAVAALADGDVVLQTSRQLVTGSDGASSLELSRRVSSAVVEVVARVLARVRPRFVVAKGGITSSDVATGGLGIGRALVRGPMLPGLVSLWEPVDGPAVGVPYVVFPGNVGDDAALATVVATLRRSADDAGTAADAR